MLKQPRFCIAEGKNIMVISWIETEPFFYYNDIHIKRSCQRKGRLKKDGEARAKGQEEKRCVMI